MTIVCSSDHAHCLPESSLLRTFPVCVPVCGTQCKQTCECVQFWATSSFLDCVNIAGSLEDANLLWVMLGVTKLMRSLRVVESEVSSEMCRSVTEDFTPGRRQWYQVQCFPNFVARGPLLASENSYGSWHPYFRKYSVRIIGTQN